MVTHLLSQLLALLGPLPEFHTPGLHPLHTGQGGALGGKEGGRQPGLGYSRNLGRGALQLPDTERGGECDSSLQPHLVNRCMYVRTYVRIYILVHIIHTYVCTYICTYVCCIQVRTYVHMCIHTFICTYVRTYVCMCIAYSQTENILVPIMHCTLTSASAAANLAVRAASLALETASLSSTTVKRAWSWEKHIHKNVYIQSLYTHKHTTYTPTHTPSKQRETSLKYVCSTSLHCTIQNSTTVESLKHSSETEKLRMCVHTNVRTHVCIIGIHMYVCTHLCKDMQVSPTKSECNSSLLHTRFVQLTILLSNAHNCPMYVCTYTECTHVRLRTWEHHFPPQ